MTPYSKSTRIDFRDAKPFKIDGKECVFIQATRGKFALIDLSDYEFLSQWKWQARCPRGRWYITRSQFNGNSLPRLTTIGIHQQIMGIVKGMHVDHINGNGLDNRRENLRLSSPRQNIAHRLKTSKNAGYRGVSFHQNRWQSSCAGYYLGRFATEEAAALAYDEKAIQLWGEFAVVNFPDRRIIQ